MNKYYTVGEETALPVVVYLFGFPGGGDPGVGA